MDGGELSLLALGTCVQLKHGTKIYIKKLVVLTEISGTEVTLCASFR